jgi:hypothetical protein
LRCLIATGRAVALADVEKHTWKRECDCETAVGVLQRGPGLKSESHESRASRVTPPGPGHLACDLLVCFLDALGVRVRACVESFALGTRHVLAKRLDPLRVLAGSGLRETAIG